MGEGYSVLVWDGYGSGLNMLNPRVLTDELGRNWWPCPGYHGPQGGAAHEDFVVDFAIRDRQLPWLDSCPADKDWQGAPTNTTDFKNWKVIR